MNIMAGLDDSELVVITNGPDDTAAVGTIIGEYLQKGDIVALIGELGSGKTCITQGIAKGMGVPGRYYVTSPTFTLINEYPGRIMLYHLDVYRLSGSRDLIEMGYEEYFYGNGIIVIEWAEKIIDILPPDSLFMYMRYMDERKREIKISGNNSKTILLLREALDKGGFL